MFTLYRKGFSHVVTAPDGTEVQVDLIRVTEAQLEEYRKKGWSDDPKKVKVVKDDDAEPDTSLVIRGKKVAIPDDPEKPVAEWVKPDGKPAKEETGGEKKPPIVDHIGYNSNDIKDENSDTE